MQSIRVVQVRGLGGVAVEGVVRVLGGRRVLDGGISYEQELFLAAAQGLPVVAVAAVVPQPLNSLIAIEPGIHTMRDLDHHTIGITGVPSDYATLKTMLASVGLGLKDVKVVAIGYSLLPALLAHKIDAVLGVYRNVEGISYSHVACTRDHPVDSAGVPSYDETDARRQPRPVSIRSQLP